MRFDHETLRRLRLQRTWSQQKAAEEIGIGVDRYGRYEGGRVDFARFQSVKDIRNATQYETLINMAAVFDLPGPESLLLPDPGPASPGPRLPPPIQPPGGPYDAAFYVHREAEEKDALNCLRSPGAPVVLQGAQWHGKATLLGHLLEEMAEAEVPGEPPARPARIVRFKLSTLPAADLRSLDGLLRELGRRMLDTDGAERLVTEAWKRPGSPKGNLTWLLSQHALPRRQRLFLVIEKAELLRGSPCQDDFFELLRSWAEAEREDPLSSVRIVVTLAIESAWLLDNTAHSPFFTKASILRLDELQREQRAAMVELHGLAADGPALDRLERLIGGHPYLWRLISYKAAVGGASLGQLLDQADLPGRVFGDHLEHLRKWLEAHALLPALADLLAQRPVEPGPFAALYAKGLAAEGGGRQRVRYPLYEEYFAGPPGKR